MGDVQEDIHPVIKKLRIIKDKKLTRGCDKTNCSYNVSQVKKKSDAVTTAIQDAQQYAKGFACRQGSNDNRFADYFVTNCVAEKGVSLNGMFENMGSLHCVHRSSTCVGIWKQSV